MPNFTEREIGSFLIGMFVGYALTVIMMAIVAWVTGAPLL